MLLAHQLKRAKITPSELPANLLELLVCISEHYVHMDRDRRVSGHTLGVLSRETEELLSKLRREKLRTEAMLDAATHGIAEFARALASDDEACLDLARESFTSALVRVSEPGNINFSIRKHAEELGKRLTMLSMTARRHGALQRELELAGAVQQLMLPADPELQFGTLRVRSYYRPSTTCSGDWWHAARCGDGRVCIFIGDVVGHGAAAALFTAQAGAVCDCFMALPAMSVESLFERLNAILFQSGGGNWFMTFQCAVIEVDEHKLTIFSAGHPFPYIRRKDGTVQALVGRSDPLGCSATASVYQRTLQLGSGDALLLYSDGLPELRRPGASRQFSYGRLRRLLQCSAPWALFDDLIASVEQFQQSEPTDDDITFVVAEFAKEARPGGSAAISR